MTDAELKKISELIKASLKPLGTRLDIMDSRQEMTNDKLDKIQETLENHTAALIEIESILKGYTDMYKMNDSEIRKIKRHLGLPIVSE